MVGNNWLEWHLFVAPKLNKTIESIIKLAYDICICHEAGILRWIKTFVRDNIIDNESDYFDPRAETHSSRNQFKFNKKQI